jgi:hypothetical protein
MGTLAYRAMGAALLDHATYEGIEADRSATWQALTVVLLSSLAAGLGAGGLDGPGWSLLVMFAGLALAGWLAWAVLILEIGGRHLKRRETRVDLGELLRTVGFAASPGLLQVFGLIAEIRLFVFVAVWLWTFAAMVVAVRHALDFANAGRAVLVCAVALVIVLGTALVAGLAVQRVVV